jgi:hypothetical protein
LYPSDVAARRPERLVELSAAGRRGILGRRGLSETVEDVLKKEAWM